MVPSAEDSLRRKLMAAARKLGERADYRSAGTVEFLVEQDTASFYFLEVNTRLQVSNSACTLAPVGLSEKCLFKSLEAFELMVL